MRFFKACSFLFSSCAFVPALLTTTELARADEVITSDQKKVEFTEDDSTLTIAEGVTIVDKDEAVDVSGVSATVFNYGSLKSEGVGIVLDGGGDIAVYSEGEIVSETDSNSIVYGIFVEDDAASVLISNSGSISSIITDENFDAGGIFVGNAAGPVIVESSGEITAEAHSDYNARGIEIYNDSADDIATVDIQNSGSISTYSKTDDASGIFIRSEDADSIAQISIGNTVAGGIYAESGDEAFGISVANFEINDIGDIEIENAGTIIATSNDVDAVSVAVVNLDFSSLGDISIVNESSGEVAATGVEDASGIQLENILGAQVSDINIENLGTVSANSSSETATGINVANVDIQAIGDIKILNASDGEITAAGYEDVAGVWVQNYGSTTIGDIEVENSGTISASSLSDTASGMFVYNRNIASVDDIIVVNRSGGVISISEALDAVGINVFNDIAGSLNSVTVSNLGEISLEASDDAIGIKIENDITDNLDELSVVNSGTVTATALDDAFGIEIENSVRGDLSAFIVSNTGDLKLVAADDGGGIAIENSVDGDGALLTVINQASIEVEADDNGFGIDIQNSVSGENPGIEVFNSGDIAVMSVNQARGISIDSEGVADSISIENSAVINVQSTSNEAYGFYVDDEGSDDGIILVNSGDVIVSGETGSYGVYAMHDGGTSILTLSNYGTISAQTAISLQNQVVKINLNKGSVIEGDVYVGGSKFNIFAEGGQNLALDYTLDATETPIVAVDSELPFVHNETSGAVYTLDPTIVLAHSYYLQTLSAVVNNIVDDNSRQQGDLAIWGEAFGGYQTRSGNGSQSDVSQSYAGVVSGGSQNFGDFSFGLFAGGALNKLKDDENDLHDVTGQTALAGVYTSLYRSGYWVNAAMTGGYVWFNSERKITSNTAPGGVETAMADYNGVLVAPSVSIGAKLGKRASVGIRGQYAGLFLNEYEEIGTDANLAVESEFLQSAAIRAQAEFVAVELMMETGKLVTSVRVGADGYFDLGSQSKSATLASLPLDLPDYQSDANTIGFVGLSLNWESANSAWQLSGDVEGLVGTEDYRDFRGLLAAKIRF